MGSVYVMRWQAVGVRAGRFAALSLVLAMGIVGLIVLTPIAAPRERLSSPGTVYLAADGTVLQRDTSAGIRIPVALERVAPVMVQATLSAEDQRFFDHPGFDPIAMLRAATHPGTRSGASTLTQQLARRLYLGDDAGPLPVRKLQEAFVAVRLEAHYSKGDILAAYLNDAPYGRATYGVEAAARVYFGVAAADLDLARASFLAGLPRLPSLGASDAFLEARTRQRYVLNRLVDDGEVSREAADAAFAAPLNVLPEVAPPIAPHFVAFAHDEIARVRPDLAGRDDLVIETTLDAGLQYESERVATMRLAEQRALADASAAVVVIEPGSGRLLAMVGNATAKGTGGEINMAVAPRQPGSALKPFLYALALEQGMTAASEVLDVPVTFDADGEAYAPINYDRHFRGPVPVRVALASSLNVPAVRVLDQLGIQPFLGIARRFGLGTLRDAESYGHSLVLGGGEVRLLDLTGAYGALAGGGQLTPSYAVERVRDGSGRVLYEHVATPPSTATSADVAWIIGDILRDPDARAPGFGYESALEASVPASVKTGTTTEFRDNWTVGYTANRVVGVWVGHEDNRAMAGVSGVTGAAPIWRDVIEMATAATLVIVPAPPTDLVQVTVCTPTGLLPGHDCPSPAREWFIRGTEPTAVEHYYIRAADGQLTVNPPAEARTWAADAGLSLAAPTSGSGQASVAISQPGAGTTVYVAPETGATDLVIRASSTRPATLRYYIDGVFEGAAPSGGAFVWSMRPGRHQLEAVAEDDGIEIGRAVSSFEVRER